MFWPDRLIGKVSHFCSIMPTAVASSNPLLWHGLTKSSFPPTPKPEVWPNTNMSSFVSATVAIVYGHPFSQILMRGWSRIVLHKIIESKMPICHDFFTYTFSPSSKITLSTTILSANSYTQAHAFKLTFSTPFGISMFNPHLLKVI